MKRNAFQFPLNVCLTTKVIISCTHKYDQISYEDIECLLQEYLETRGHFVEFKTH